MYSQEELNEIIKALKVIKKVCKDQNRNCETCPLRHGDDACAIIDNMTEPMDWEIYNPNNPPHVKLIVEY